MLHVAKFDMARTVVSGLQALGIYDAMVDSPIGPKRLDANETAAFARELEFIFAEVYRREFPDLVGRSLIPAKTGVPSGAESHTYTEVVEYGKAGIIHNYAKNFPSTEVQGFQNAQVIRSLGDSYNYSIQDLRAAALTKIHMPTEKADNARTALEQLLDSLILSGDSTTGLVGLNSASLVANFNSVTKGTQTTGTHWQTASAKEILADVLALFQSIPNATLNKHNANTLVLDGASYNLVAFSMVQAIDGTGAAVGFSGQTILQFLMANVPGLTSVIPWFRLNAAGASGHSRIFAMDRNPSVIYQVIPQDFEQMPPQPVNMSFLVNCHMRWGGVVSPYPKAIAYMDGTGG